MTLIICPGIHNSHLTQEFLEGLQWKRANCLVFPAEEYPAYSAVHVSDFLRSHLPLQSSISLISFSAGVVGAISAAWTWQLWGGQVKAFFALDGWGVPLAGNFPIYRLSHDYFTHWSSALLGTGEDSFYADPPVDHLDLWRSPHTVPGWRVHSDSSRTVQPRSPTTAANFLQQVLASHEYLGN